MQESQSNVGKYIWQSVPEELLACANACVPTHSGAGSAWAPVTRDSVLVRKSCGCLQVMLWKNAKKGSSMCRTCAAPLRTHRGEEQQALELVKSTVHEHMAGWWLLREHAMYCSASNTVRYLDCLLIHERVRSLVDPESTMLAVELDGSSHGSNPFQFGTEREVAMWEQEKRDEDKDAELRHRGILSVRMCGCTVDAMSLLQDQLDWIAYRI